MSGSSQNIETISTQFRILSTVKATMLSKFHSGTWIRYIYLVMKIALVHGRIQVL